MRTLEGIVISNYFLNRILIVQEIRTKFYKWEGNDYQDEEITHRTLQIFISYSLDKGKIFRIYKELQKLNTHRTNNPINKLANELDISQKKKHLWPKST
jgi:hypothetical protein